MTNMKSSHFHYHFRQAFAPISVITVWYGAINDTSGTFLFRKLTGVLAMNKGIEMVHVHLAV